MFAQPVQPRRQRGWPGWTKAASHPPFPPGSPGSGRSTWFLNCFSRFLRASPTDMNNGWGVWLLLKCQVSRWLGNQLPTPLSLIVICPTRLSSISTSREQRNIAQRCATLTCLFLAEFDLPWSHSLWWLLPTVGEREDDILTSNSQSICNPEQPAWS